MVDQTKDQGTDNLSAGEQNKERLANQVKDTAQTNFELVRNKGKKAFNQSVTAFESKIQGAQGQVQGGIENFQARIDEGKEKLNTLKEKGVGGLIDEGAESLTNMATDAAISTATGLLTSKLGGQVKVEFSDPDSYGVIHPVSASLEADGNDTLAGIIQLLTGLGGGVGGEIDQLTDKVIDKVIETSADALYQGAIDLAGRVGGGFGNSALAQVAGQTAATTLIDQIEQNIAATNPLATSNPDLSFPTGDSDGSGNLLFDTVPNNTTAIASTEADTGFANSNTQADSDLKVSINENIEIGFSEDGFVKDAAAITGENGQDVLTAIKENQASRDDAVFEGTRYQSYIRKVVADDEQNYNGVLQGLNTKLATDIRKRVRNLAPSLSKDEINEAIFLAQGDAEEFSRAVALVASKSRKQYDVIETTLKGINSTIAFSSQFTPAKNVFEEPYRIGANQQAWKNGQGDPKFSYVSSVEELDADFTINNREITEMVVHWTETNTNRNIGSEEINKFHVDQGLEGIGYHYVIRRNGSLQRGRPVGLKGQHAPINSHDERSIGVVFVGGINSPTQSVGELSAASLTRSQFNTFDHLCRAFYNRFPGGQIVGHNDIDDNEVDPGFDVLEYVEARFGKESLFEDPTSEDPLTIDEILGL